MWYFPDCEVVYYQASSSSASVRCVEFEATRKDSLDEALATVERTSAPRGLRARRDRDARCRSSCSPSWTRRLTETVDEDEGFNVYSWSTMTMKPLAITASLLTILAVAPAMRAQSVPLDGPVGPSPYTVLRGWQKPFAGPGYAFGGNSGVFAESPDRIFILQRGEFKLPDPLPAEYGGFAGSLKMNVLSLADRREWRNCLYTLDRTGKVKERWTEWDHLCEGSSGPGPHRIRISPYDQERRVWVVNETFHTIYVFSNDGKKLLTTLGEKNVAGSDAMHFAKPQDVAFLPDGRVLIADGLDNHRVMILDRDLKYSASLAATARVRGSSAASMPSPSGLATAFSRSIARAAASTCSGRRPIRPRWSL